MATVVLITRGVWRGGERFPLAGVHLAETSYVVNMQQTYGT